MSYIKKIYSSLGNGQEIKICLDYRTDTVSWATSQKIEPGYYLSCIPVKRTKGEGYNLEESGAFTGFNLTILPCNRRSAKREQQAISIMETKIPWIMDKFKYLDTPPESVPEIASLPPDGKGDKDIHMFDGSH